MITGSKELIRDINTNLIFTQILEHGPISRASIAKELGLTKATVSTIVFNLMEKGLIEEIGTATGGVGRNPVLLQFVPSCGYIISIDLSSEHITLLSAHLGGGNCHVKQYPNDNSADTILNTLITIIETHVRTLPYSHYGLVGISLGIHGIVHHNQVLFTPYSPYSGIDFVNTLKQHFKVSVLLENEANLSVLGEYTFCYHNNNMIGLSVHSGIGLGIMIQGELFSGTNGYAGEFGHTIIEVDGKSCPCGNHGCLEQYGSEMVLLKDLAFKKGISHISPEDFALLYQSGDKDALHTMELFIKYIVIGINNILNTLNPELIVINSSFTMNFPSIVEEIQCGLKNHIHNTCHLVPSGLQDMSILLGGICQIRKLFLKL